MLIGSPGSSVGHPLGHRVVRAGPPPRRAARPSRRCRCRRRARAGALRPCRSLDDRLDHRAVVAGLERLGAEQQPQPRLVDGVGELVGAVGRVDVDQDRADLGGGVLRDRPLRAVRRPHPDPVALLDPGADQPPGERVHVAVELGVGPSPPGGELDQRLVVAVRRDGPLEVGPDRLLDQGRLGLSTGVGLHGSTLDEHGPTGALADRTVPAPTAPDSRGSSQRSSRWPWGTTRSKYAATSSSSHRRDSRRPSASIAR